MSNSIGGLPLNVFINNITADMLVNDNNLLDVLKNINKNKLYIDATPMSEELDSFNILKKSLVELISEVYDNQINPSDIRKQYLLNKSLLSVIDNLKTDGLSPVKPEYSKSYSPKIMIKKRIYNQNSSDYISKIKENISAIDTRVKNSLPTVNIDNAHYLIHKSADRLEFIDTYRYNKGDYEVISDILTEVEGHDKESYLNNLSRNNIEYRNIRDVRDYNFLIDGIVARYNGPSPTNAELLDIVNYMNSIYDAFLLEYNDGVLDGFPKGDIVVTRDTLDTTSLSDIIGNVEAYYSGVNE